MPFHVHISAQERRSDLQAAADKSVCSNGCVYHHTRVVDRRHPFFPRGLGGSLFSGPQLPCSVCM